MAIIPFTATEIEQLNDAQITAIKKLIRINYYADDDTVLSIYDLPTITSRQVQLQTNFYVKTKQCKPNSMAHKVMNEILTKPLLLPVDIGIA